MTDTISIITVNYNGFDVTCGMIESLAAHMDTPYELIVVDNGSEKDEATMLAARYPHIRAIRSLQNRGFAGGNNIGMRAASGRYLFFLNNDTFITDNSVRHLRETLDSHPETGCVCPKIKFASDGNPVQFAGYTALSSVTLRNSLIGFGCTDDGRFDTPAVTPYAHGAAMMVRRETVEKAGPMPEMYFLYYEELDWSERIKEAGYDIRYEPRCTVYHMESRTTGADSPLKAFYLTRNRLLFASRNRRGIKKILSLAYLSTVAPAKNAISYLMKGRRDLAQAVAQGVSAFASANRKTGKNM